MEMTSSSGCGDMTSARARPPPPAPPAAAVPSPMGLAGELLASASPSRPYTCAYHAAATPGQASCPPRAPRRAPRRAVLADPSPAPAAAAGKGLSPPDQPHFRRSISLSTPRTAGAPAVPTPRAPTPRGRKSTHGLMDSSTDGTDRAFHPARSGTGREARARGAHGWAAAGAPRGGPCEGGRHALDHLLNRSPRVQQALRAARRRKRGAPRRPARGGPRGALRGGARSRALRPGGEAGGGAAQRAHRRARLLCRALRPRLARATPGPVHPRTARPPARPQAHARPVLSSTRGAAPR